MTRKNHLIDCFMEAKTEGAGFVYVEIDLGADYPSSELIVNPIDNVDVKLAYLCKTYDDNLGHPHAPIRIRSFGYFDNMSQLEYVRNNFKELH